MTRFRTTRTFSTGFLSDFARCMLKKQTPTLWGMALLLLALGAQSAQAQVPQLQFFKNYFLVGDYAVSGVGLRGQGDATGFANGSIYFDGKPELGGNHGPRIPDNVEVVAAYLYWETIEKTNNPSSMNGKFDGEAIVAKTLGAGHAAPCWSGGGTTGSSQGAPTLRVYRADVLRYLPVAGGLRVVNDVQHTVSLADSGSNGGGVPLTEGASLVVVYRYLFPDSLTKNLRSIVIVDGAATTSNTYPSYTQQITGFYQASGTPGRMTHIVGDGQSNFTERLTVNGQLVSGVSTTNPFQGAQGFSWDN